MDRVVTASPVRSLLVAVPAVMLAACRAPTAAQLPPRFEEAAAGMLDTGDLIFLDLDCGELCDAMTRVTGQQFRVEGPALSHVGILRRGPEGMTVLEAWPALGVVETPMGAVMSRPQRSAPRFARLRAPYRRFGQRAVAAAMARIGTLYDDDFLPDAGKLYCSLLVFEAYREAFGPAESPFHLLPMYFGAERSPERDVWRRYFEGRGTSVPDAVPGISPLGAYLQARATVFE